jgi:hypothetical protein
MVLRTRKWLSLICRTTKSFIRRAIMREFGGIVFPPWLVNELTSVGLVIVDAVIRFARFASYPVPLKA